MGKVYVVTSGKYSDYHIIGVTMDEEKANRIADLLSTNYYDEANVEPYDTDEFEKQWKDETVIFHCQLDNRRRYANHRVNAFIPYGQDEKMLDYPLGVVHHFRDEINDFYRIYVRAKDIEHAIKIAEDKIAEFRAQEEGIV